ncbi:MAG: hypothetical protein ACXVXD_06335 [Nocardioidaceae bacterium]
MSWIDQFVLRRGDSIFAPFGQVVAAAERLARVAEDRSGLPRHSYDLVGAAGYRARVLAELARVLEEDVNVLSRRADEVLRPGVDGVGRERVLTVVFTEAVRAHAMLMDTCSQLLVLCEDLMVLRRAKSRLELMGAIEALRGAASTSHLTVLANLPRITDVTLYDQLSAGLESLDGTLALANRLTSTLRSDTRYGRPGAGPTGLGRLAQIS